MAIGAVDLNNTSALLQASGMFGRKSGGAEENSKKYEGWNKAAVAAGYTPQIQAPGVQKVQPSEKVGKTEAIPEGSTPAAISAIGARGMRANDTEMWTNQPMAMGSFHRGKQTGVIGADLRVLG